jgi:hypothetical protein
MGWLWIGRNSLHVRHGLDRFGATGPMEGALTCARFDDQHVLGRIKPARDCIVHAHAYLSSLWQQLRQGDTRRKMNRQPFDWSGS